jgi:hypothetical protein
LVIDQPIETDLPRILEVVLSNPAFLATHEGSGGEPGAYDLGMLQRDLAVAEADPLRRALVIRDRADGAVFGWSDLLDRHPRVELPWNGLL